MSDNVRTWTAGVPVEDEAWAQIRNLAALPILAGPIAVMPDVHLGKGAAVGTVIPTRAAIIPAAVGVDIGCGMVAVRTTLTAADLPDSLAAIRAAIERAIPVGFAAHKDVPRLDDALDEGAALERRRASIVRRFDGLAIMARLPKYEVKRVTHQLGSLGGGNHFIEICLDEADRVWAMLHSGSRNVGNTIGETAIAMARRRAEREHIHLPDRDLAWLPENTAEFDEYVAGLAWAQDYAALNRDIMLGFVLAALRRALPGAVAVRETAVNCHHNYAQREAHGGRTFWVTRKGAVSGARRRARHRAGQHGHALVHRPRQGQPRVVRVVQPRRRAADVARRGAPALHPRRPRRPDGGGGMPQGCGRHRRVAAGLQGHRGSHGGASGPYRDRAYSEASSLRQGLTAASGPGRT